MGIHKSASLTIIAAKYDGILVSFVHAITNDHNGTPKIVKYSREDLIYMAQTGAVLYTSASKSRTQRDWLRVAVADLRGKQYLTLEGRQQEADDLGEVRLI